MVVGERERKVLIIAAVSLVVAVVCFGVLESTGAVDNGPLKFGGAIAGFIGTALALNHIWGPPGLERQAIDAKLPLVVDEVVKVLDLRDAAPTATPQRAPLADYYRVRRTEEDARMTLHYATSGSMEFLESPTHPNRAHWTPGPPHVDAAGKPLPSGYDLEIVLSGGAEAVVTRVLYVNAFKGLAEEALETHLEYPTGRLAMILFMPETIRCTDAVGCTKIARGALTSVKPGPVVMQDGALVYWAVDKPVLGANYQIRWRWQDRSAPIVAGSPPMVCPGPPSAAGTAS